MKEVTETVDLTGAADLYPGVRKIAVDMPNRTAYVFTSGNRATTVTGAEFDELVKVVPAGGEEAPQGEEAPVEVEPVEAVITVVAEEGAAEKPAQSKRRKEN